MVKKSYKLKEGDIIEIDDFKRFVQPIVLEEAPNIDLPVLLEKEDYLVIYKPKWVLSHPNSIWDVKVPSVVWFLYHKYKDLPTISNFIRAGLIHRLDKETDWLMIVVKTEIGLKYFKSLFQKKTELVEKIFSSDTDLSEIEKQIPLRKFYKAEVNITEEWKQFLKHIKSFPYYIIEEVRPKIPHYRQSKIWITKILEIIGNKLDLEILTWRTHQIRYHLAIKWLPIKWDYLYGIKDNADEMKLTAYRLIFKDLEWKLIDISL